jgi:D-3-phosphoglycerate dehydrogenase
MTRVLVTDYAWPSLDVERDVLESIGAELVVAETGATAELVSLAADVDAILTCFAEVPAIESELGDRAEYAGADAIRVRTVQPDSAPTT